MKIWEEQSQYLSFQWGEVATVSSPDCSSILVDHFHFIDKVLAARGSP